MVANRLILALDGVVSTLGEMRMGRAPDGSTTAIGAVRRAIQHRRAMPEDADQALQRRF